MDVSEKQKKHDKEHRNLVTPLKQHTVVQLHVHKIVDFNREMILRSNKKDKSVIKNPHKISLKND